MAEIMQSEGGIIHGTPEWHTARSNGVTGTDIGILMGINPYKNESDLILSKLGMGKKFTGNSATRCGQMLEPYIADLWSYRKRTILIGGTFTVCNENNRYIGSPDYLTGFGHGLEIKTGADKTFERGIPLHYSIQGKWYSMITGRSDWHTYCVIVPKDRSKVPLDADHDYIMDWLYRRPVLEESYSRDEDLEHEIKIIADRFLNRVDYLKAKRV